MLIGAAAMVNIWAILRFQRRKRGFHPPDQTENRSELAKTSIQKEWDNSLASFSSIFLLLIQPNDVFLR
jgi:hypothetical protein